jgi:protein phosphatase
MAETRPPHFPPGMPVGERYTIEGLVRLSEGRMFYLANDVRPDKPEDGQKGRRYLISTRWKEGLFENFEAFARLGLVHPGLAAPVDVFRHEGQLVSVIPYNGEGLLLDEAAPLPNGRILEIAQRIAGTLAFLHVNGVRLGPLKRANILISPDNTVRLFDFDVLGVTDQPVPDGVRSQELKAVGELLGRFCNVEAEALAQFMRTVGEGEYPSPAAFGRAVEKRFDAVEHLHYPSVLGAMTDVGLTRQLNEDNWGWRKLSNRATLYVVADGMGGHDGGEVASALAVSTICSVAQQAEASEPPEEAGLEELLDAAFQTANNRIKEDAESKNTDMGTTLVSMLVLENRVAFVANVGDSRAYMLRDQTLHQVSEDHSLVAKMVERGRITAEEARHHPHSNILLRTVGTERDVDIDIFKFSLEPGDKIIMCSDGLWGEVEDRDIESILNTYADPRIAARELVRASHHGGGKDNVTLMIVEVPGADGQPVGANR